MRTEEIIKSILPDSSGYVVNVKYIGVYMYAEYIEIKIGKPGCITVMTYIMSCDCEDREYLSSLVDSVLPQVIPITPKNK